MSGTPGDRDRQPAEGLAHLETETVPPSIETPSMETPSMET
jgi:hypothetical protein